MPDKLARTRVVKRLLPDQAGALKHARRHGDALVCVRYRHDPTGRTRYTTVELVVDEAPLRDHPSRDDTLVSARIDPHDNETRRRAMTLGAQWNPQSRMWSISRKAARTLGLVPAKHTTKK